MGKGKGSKILLGLGIAAGVLGLGGLVLWASAAPVLLPVVPPSPASPVLLPHQPPKGPRSNLHQPQSPQGPRMARARSLKTKGLARSK